MAILGPGPGPGGSSPAEGVVGRQTHKTRGEGRECVSFICNLLCLFVRPTLWDGHRPATDRCDVTECGGGGRRRSIRVSHETSINKISVNIKRGRPYLRPTQLHPLFGDSSASFGFCSMDQSMRRAADAPADVIETNVCHTAHCGAATKNHKMV